MTGPVGDVRIRAATPDDALIVAALTLQCAVHRSGAREPGFLDRFARAWLAQAAERPTWIAEVDDEHGGLLLTSVRSALPWPGSSSAAELVVDTLFVRPENRGVGVGELLLRAAVDHARDAGMRPVSMSAGPRTREMVERIGFVRADDWFRVDP